MRKEFGGCAEDNRNIGKKPLVEDKVMVVILFCFFSFAWLLLFTSTGVLPNSTVCDEEMLIICTVQ